MKSKNKNFKIIGSTLIALFFLFIAFGSGESSASSDSNNSNENELNKATSEKIIESLCENEMTSSEDISGGNEIATYEISLKMEKDKTFKYKFEERYFNGTVSPITAKGTYELIGKVYKTNLPGVTDKYGDDVGQFQYEQKIQFKGTTNEGKNFVLNGILNQSGDAKELAGKWFFCGADKSSNNQQSTSGDNFELPSEFIYP